MSDTAVLKHLQAGDRILFLGDSITQAGTGPTGYVTLVQAGIMETYPDLGIEIIGSGQSGHRVPDCLQRLDRDVLSHHPTLVVIYVGINDVWHSTRGSGTPKQDYQFGLTEIVDRCQRAGARVLLCTPSVIGEKTDGSNSLDAMLEEYAQISREIALQTGTQLLDLRKEFIDHLRTINPSNKPHSILTTDGVHLNAAGNKFLAHAILQALQVVPPENPSRYLRHLILLQFKKSVSTDQMNQIVTDFQTLAETIDVVDDFETGTDISVEGLANGLTHCFLFSLRNEADRAIYLSHPQQKKLMTDVQQYAQQVLTLDYWS